MWHFNLETDLFKNYSSMQVFLIRSGVFLSSGVLKRIFHPVLCVFSLKPWLLLFCKRFELPALALEWWVELCEHFWTVVLLTVQYLWICYTWYQGQTKQMTEGAQGGPEDSFSFIALFIHSGIVLQSHRSCQTLPDRHLVPVSFLL